MDKGQVWTLMGWTVTSNLPDAPQSTPDPSRALLASFLFSRRSPPDLGPQYDPDSVRPRILIALPIQQRHYS